MKRAFLLFLPLVLILGIGILGCSEDESTPYFTRLTVTPACGVAPLQVEGLAIVSGGNETGSPTGGNNNLEMKWDFGDGVNSNTSISYHDYMTPGEYTVTVTGTDPDGKVAQTSQLVRVFPDTLIIEATHNIPDSTVVQREIIQFDVRALACNIDPDDDDDYRNLTFKWEMDNINQTVYTGRSPQFRYPLIGEYRPRVTVTMPGLAVTRTETLFVRVLAAP